MIRLPRRGGRRLRLGYARIFHEGNAFSPLRTGRDAFESFHLHEGAALRARCGLRGSELKGFLRHAELSGFVQASRLAGRVETVPLLSAMAIPSGLLTMDTFDWLRTRLQSALSKAGPLDGVYLALHGAMQVDGLDQAPEGVLIADVRNLTGAPVAASYDLHANLAPSMADHLTVMTAYRTNPHRDLARTGYAAGRAFIDALRDHTRPTHAWRKLPMLLGGGSTVDFLQPMRPLFGELRRLEREDGVLGAHLFMAHPFSNAHDLGWAVHVTTDGDPERASQLVDRLADRVFETRHIEAPKLQTIDRALDDVAASRLARRTGTISLVDIGDVVGAGAPGGSTHLLEALVRRADALRVYVPIADQAAVAACRPAAIGDPVDLVLRGIPSGAPQPDVPVHGRLMARIFNESGEVLRLDVGRLSIAVTERPPLTLSPRFWKELGLSAWNADAVVQKSFFHYRFFYALVNRANIGVLSAGSSSLDNIRKLTFDQPIWPIDKVDDWRPFDRIRRAVTSPAIGSTRA